MDFKSLAGKAKDALRNNQGAIDKVAKTVNDKTGGKYSSQVSKATDAARKFAGGDGPR